MATSNPAGSARKGLYHEGTRYLSRLVLEFEGSSPFFLSSTVRDENDQLTVALTNPDLLRDGQVVGAAGHTLHSAEEISCGMASSISECG